MERQSRRPIKPKGEMRKTIEKIREENLSLQETDRQNRVAKKRAALMELYNEDSISLPKSCQGAFTSQESTEIHETPSLTNDSFGCEQFETLTDHIDIANEIQCYTAS